MGKLTLMLAMPLFALTGAAARGDDIDRWRPIVAEASQRFGIPISWVERVIAAESAGQTMLGGRPITSRAGAMGLMQLMPGTWFTMRARLGLGANPHDPHDNILAGTFYLRLMYEQFGYPGLFGAYNAGPGRYGGSLVGRRTLPLETQDYLRKTTSLGAASTETLPPRRPPETAVTATTASSLFVPRGQPTSIFMALTDSRAPR